jgi:hypothetical protein
LFGKPMSDVVRGKSDHLMCRIGEAVRVGNER